MQAQQIFVDVGCELMKENIKDAEENRRLVKKHTQRCSLITPVIDIRTLWEQLK